MNVTKFATRTNPFTNEDTIKLVAIPAIQGRAIKGTTAHDAKFEKLLEFKQALQMPEHEFAGVRKALQRFMDNKGIRKLYSIRQYKDHRTKTYSMWMVDTPPKVVIPRKGEKCQDPSQQKS